MAFRGRSERSLATDFISFHLINFPLTLYPSKSKDTQFSSVTVGMRAFPSGPFVIVMSLAAIFSEDRS